MISPTEPKVNEDIAFSAEKENEQLHAINVGKRYESQRRQRFTHLQNRPENEKKRFYSMSAKKW